jgi:hypothetical protein
MMYKGMSWTCILFGLILFVSAYELVRYQQSSGEIVSMILVGVMGSVMFGLGVFGLWELWRKRT